MKKLFITAALVCSLFIGACPAEAVKNEAVFEVGAFDIIRGDENGNLNLEDDVTRGEFATMTMRLLGYDDLIMSSDTAYKDVASDNVHSGSIGLITALGFASGDGNGYFRPNDTVKVQDCLKILVRALGYGAVAEKRGGYPAGYIAVANTLGLTKDISGSISGNATRGDAVSMIYESMYVEILETGYSEKNEYVKNGETLKSGLMNRDDVKHIKGVVTANYDTWLVHPVSDIKTNEIEIDNERYICGNNDLSDLLGLNVDVYYREEASGKRTILNISETTKNEKLTVYSKDVDSIAKNKLVYCSGDKKSKQSIDFDSEAVFIYNGRLLTEYTISEITAKSGNYVCIDNNNDNKFDYIFINEYQNSIVDRVNVNGCIYLKNELLISGLNYVLADAEDDEKTCVIKRENGAAITVEDIEKDNIVTVYESMDKSYTKIIVSDNIVTGVIESIDDDENIVISGTEYAVGSSLNKEDAVLGTEVRAYINEFNEAVYVEESESSDWKYGYILRTEKKGLSSCKAKIVVGDFVRNDTEVDETSDDGDTIPVLLCRNSEVIVVDLAPNVKLDGKKLDADNAIGKMNRQLPVKFKLRADGKLSHVEYFHEEFGSTMTKIDYNAKDKTFGGINGILPFGVNEETRVICVPENDNPSNEDILSQIKIDNRDASVRYLASGYDRDADTKCVNVLMIIADMTSDTALNITKNSDIGIVQKSVNTNGDDGFDEQIVTVLTGDGEIELKVKDVEGSGDTKNLKNGDFIIYELSNDGYLVNSLIFKSLGKKFDNNVSDRNSVKGCIAGIVTEIQKNEINNAKNMRVHVINIRTDDMTYRVEFPARNIPNFYVYDRESKSSRLGTIDDVMYGDTVCVAMPEENVKDCVILRGN